MEGMPDLSVYERQLNFCTDFDSSDDHMVPHPGNGHCSGDLCKEDNCKKPLCEVTPVNSNAAELYTSGSVCQGKEERDSTTLKKKRNMLGKDPWSHTSDDIFAASTDMDPGKCIPGLSSDGSGTSSHCVKSSNVIPSSEFCADGCILNDTSTAADNNSYNIPLSDIPKTDDLNLFSNDCDKGSSDLLYYGWPDIGNLEDVDTMLRSCDSSFGLGITDNNDDLVWFTSEDPLGGTEEAMKMDFKFPYSESSALKSVSQDHEPHGSSNKKIICMSENEDELNLNNQKRQSKHQNQRQGMSASQCLGNDGSSYHIHDLRNNDNQHSSIDEADRVFTSLANQQSEPNPFCFKSQNKNSLHLDYGHAPNQTTGGPMLTGLAFPAPNESSCTSIRVHSMVSSGEPSFQETPAKVDLRGKRRHSHEFRPSLTGNQKQMGMVLDGSKHDLVSAPRQVDMSGNKLGKSDIEGDQKGASAEIGSINVLESSSVSSELDEISQEATSFHQLKQVMEQLDFRTKLCIRDSLYRLARSAGQRHNYASLSGGSADCRDSGGPLTAEGTNKCTGFMDMETDTNPIDRSIAHLLFHRPSDPSNLPAAAALKPNATMTIGGAMVGEKVGCRDETANNSDDKGSWTEKKPKT